MTRPYPPGKETIPLQGTHRRPYFLYAVVFCACLSRSNAVVLAACLAGIVMLLWQVRQAGKLTPTHGIPLVIFGVLAALNLVLAVQAAADPGPTGPTETFVTFCDQVFQGEGQVLSWSGQDITDTFVAQYQGDYAQGDYDALWQAVQAGELSLSTDTAVLTP